MRACPPLIPQLEHCGTQGWDIESGRLTTEASYHWPTPGMGVMTPNRKAKQRAKRHEYYLKRRATMTPEQLAAERAYQREYARKRRARMTPAQLDAQRKYQREYHRKWRGK
jgi:hypothetical protein